MRLSDVDLDTFKAYARVDGDQDDVLITDVILPAARGHVLAYTGLDIPEADEIADLSIACLALCVHMYDHRDTVDDKTQLNHVIESILGAHSVNLV